MAPARELVDEALRKGKPLGAANPEHGAEDDVERDALGARAKSELPADRPAVDLPVRDLADLAAVGADALAVKWRQQQLALAHVLLLVEDEHRVRTQGRLEYRGICLARVEAVRVTAENLLRERRIRHIHKPRERGEVHTEDVAVAATQAQEEADRIAPKAERLDRRGQARAWREFGR